MLEFEKTNEDGWFFSNAEANHVHDIDDEDIEKLLVLAADEDRFAYQVQQEVLHRDELKRKGIDCQDDWVLETIRTQNAAGTIVQYPYGLRALTFLSKRHLFRGENALYHSTVPSLNRHLNGIDDEREQEMHRAIAYMRKWQFASLIWQVGIVPYWEAKICDVNYDALAQHYGFRTHLLDLTNDFRTALFFATTKYDTQNDSFLPLTDEEIHQSEENKYGCIFHTPDWTIDCLNSGGFINWFHKYKENYEGCHLQSGDMDGIAMQIGYQPLYRCHYQSGYIVPMRNHAPLQEDWHFEKLRFKQSAELSARVFKMMDGGKKVFPNEGVGVIRDLIDELKTCVVFSLTDLYRAYEIDGINKRLFPTLDDLRSALQGLQTREDRIEIKDEDVIRWIPQERLDAINNQYECIDLFEKVGGVIHQKPDDLWYRNQRCVEIYGELI